MPGSPSDVALWCTWRVESRRHGASGALDSTLEPGPALSRFVFFLYVSWAQMLSLGAGQDIHGPFYRDFGQARSQPEF